VIYTSKMAEGSNKGAPGKQTGNLRRVTVVYNTDYDAELLETADESAVENSALAIRDAIRLYGYECELLGVKGPDLDTLFVRLRDEPPDLVFNLCESMNGDVQNEALFPQILEMLKIPFTGAGPLSLGLCLHKDRAKEILKASEVSTPEYVVLGEESFPAHLATLPYPFFLKLSHSNPIIL